MRGMRPRVLVTISNSIATIALLMGMVAPLGGIVHATGDTVDELHYSYGNDATSVVVDWHGAEQNIYYGPTTDYGMQAVANDPPIMPTDEAGPFREVAIGGLQAGTTYHYKVGVAGLDHTFSTEPTGDFTSVDIGDSMSSACPNPDTSQYMPLMQQLIAQQNPNFVTHGGDIAIANQCGIGAIHTFFNDVEAWSYSAAFQTALGNHEYGAPTTDPVAPPDAPFPNDNLANYKGRLRMSNAQTVQTDSSEKLTHPGCPSAPGTTGNGCVGDDWGYFTAGHVFYITYPEPEAPTAASYTDWQSHADTLMAQAQADPNIDFIISYGHRPAYTDSVEGSNTQLRASLDALAAKYSPAVGNLNGMSGKYVLNIQHHAHGFEPFKPKNGLTYVTDAAGGQGFTPEISGPIDPDSIMYMRHFGVLVTQYTASTHSMTVKFVCGSDAAVVKDVCAYGSSPWSTSFSRPGGGTVPPTSPVVQTTVSGSTSSAQIGQQVTYTATAQNTVSGSTASGATLGVTIPANMSIVSATGATVSGNTASWNLDSLVGGSAATTEKVVAQLNSGSVGSSTTVSAQLTTTDTSCAASGSICSASTSTTVAAASTTTQWITNQSLETDLTGWTGVYNSTSQSSRIAVGYDGNFSLRSTNTSSATGTNGFVDKPHWITGTGSSTTVAGTAYTGSVWVKADTAGQKFTVLLRELTPSGSGVSSKSITATASGTGWFNMNGSYTALNSGNALGFYVYASNVAAGQGFDADELSLTSPSVGAPADTTPPSAPSNFTAAATSQSQINLSWGAATDNIGVTGYTVSRNGVQVGTTTATSFADTGLAAGTTYNYTVTANDAASNVSMPATTSGTTQSLPALTAPANVQAAAVSESEIDLSWGASSGASTYSILRNGSPLVSGLTSTTYNDTHLTANTTYSYNVVATDAAGNTASSATVQATTLPAPVPPSAPTNVVATANSATQVGLSWTAATAGTAAISSYAISRGGSVVATIPATSTSYTDNNLSPSTTYTYAVTATDASGLSSPASSVATVTTPTAPVATACTVPAAGMTELSGNLSLENGQTGWTGVYNSTSAVTLAQVTGGSYDGNWALQIAPKTGSSGTAGVNNAAPIWMMNSVANATYTASAMVKASVPGEQISLMVRETTPGGTGVTYHTTTITLNDTNWQAISSAYVAKNSGDYIRYSLYASNFASSSQYFLADCLSLQTPSGN